MLLDDSSISREISLKDDAPVAVEAGWTYSPHRLGGLSSPRGDVGGARDANVFFKREGRGPRHELQFGASEQANGGDEPSGGVEVERMIKAGGPQAAVESVERALREAGKDTYLCASRGGRIRDMRLRLVDASSTLGCLLLLLLLLPSHLPACVVCVVASTARRLSNPPPSSYLAPSQSYLTWP